MDVTHPYAARLLGQYLARTHYHIPLTNYTKLRGRPKIDPPMNVGGEFLLNGFDLLFARFVASTVNTI